MAVVAADVFVDNTIPISVTFVQVYPIVNQPDSSISIGTIVYKQSGVWGSPIGLLLSLTITPSYKKAIQTDRGFQLVNV